MEKKNPIPTEARLELAKAQRATYVVSLAQSNKKLAQEALEGYEASQKGEGISWEEFCRQVALQEQDEV